MKSSNGIKIGIVGCGGISRMHMQAYEKAGARIALVFDTNRAAAESLAKEAGAQVADSLPAMAQPGAMDAVSICTPPAFHLEHCRPFVQAGIPVLCEKPLEISVPRARRLAAEVKQRRSLFMTAYCHRFHPPIIEARKLIASGQLGRPLFFRNMFAGKFVLKGNHRADPKLSGGGCVADNAAHAADLFRFLVGDVVAVQAQVANLTQMEAVEDFGLLFLRGKKGCVGEIACCYSTPVATNYVEVLCEKGAVTVNYWIPGRPDITYRIEGEKEERTIDLSQEPDRFTAEIAQFLKCVRTGAKPAVTVDDGLASAQVIAAAYASAKSGKLVRLS
jgi:predicted dehydrogenase